MALELRYKGEFLSRASTLWRVEILQESAFPYEDVGELTFDADNAVQIEWSEDDKMAAVIGSTATLKIISPTDRQYIDLYTVAVGQIRMDVYREGELYWRGMLDPEFYEEPYEMLDGYTVSLTFSDFGILDRLVFNRDAEGMSDLESIVLECLERAGLEYETVQTYISTSLSATDRAMKLSDLSVRNSNFYDEEGEAMSMQEVLEGVLQPLSLRIMQKAGQIYVYDLNGLYYQGEQKLIVWDGSTQNLGVDSTYNNIKITWSPYAQNIEFSDEVWTWDIDEDYCYYQTDEPVQRNNLWVFGYDYDDGCLTYTTEETVLGAGFSLWTETQDAGTPFKIVPFYKGEDCEGYAIRWAMSSHDTTNNRDTWTWNIFGLTSDRQISGAYQYGAEGKIERHVLIKSEELEIPLPPNSSMYSLCVSMDMQICATTTPYHDAEPTINLDYFRRYDWGYEDCSSPAEWLKDIIRYILVPVNIYFRTNDGEEYIWQNVLYDYGDNAYGMNVAIPPIFTFDWQHSMGNWVKNDGSVTTHQAFLAYYSVNDPTSGSPSCLGSWGGNSHFCGLSFVPLVEATKAEGQVTEYPTLEVGKPGKVSMEILSGWFFYSYIGESVQVDGKSRTGGTDLRISRGFYEFQDTIYDYYKVYNYIRWILCKPPQIKICNSTAYDLDLNTDDVEYSAVINPDAKEDLEINTVCGSGFERPTARGAYYETASSQMIYSLTRNGLTASVEELMIATAYSQYAERHTTLEGESEIDTDGLHVYTEQNQGDTLFIAMDNVENLIQDTGDTTYVELSYDDYEPEG